MKNSKDLTKEAPRSPRHRLGGYSLMARMIDKGRASLDNKTGEYHYACPLDQMLFGFKSVAADEVLALLRSGATDEEVVAWFGNHGDPKSAEEIAAWSNQVENWSMYGDPEKGEWFAGECTKLGLDPATATLSEYLEADDAATFLVAA
jgi:hypothetical protein